MRTANFSACIGGLVMAGIAAAADPAPLRIITDGPQVQRLNETLGLNASAIAALDLAQPQRGGATPQRITVPLEGRPVTLDLTPVSVRAPGFRIRVQQPSGTWIDADPGVEKTMQGVVTELPGSSVFATLADDGLTASIHIPGNPIVYWVEPVGTRAGIVMDAADRDNPGVLHASYRSTDMLPTPGVCGSDDHFKVAHAAARDGESNERSTCSGNCVADLAVDCDYEFFQRYGSVANVQARVESIVGQVNLQYMNDVGIRHQLTTILVRTAPGAPYLSSNPALLLSQFRNEWNNNQGAIVRDVAQLFTGKDIDGQTLGIAFIGTVCDTVNAYSLVQSDCCGSFAATTDLSAHELGHSWNAQHCPCESPNPISTMNSALTSANSFVSDITGASVASITAWRNSAACLSPDSPPPPAPGPFNLSYPLGGAFGVPLTATFDWTDAANASYYLVTIALDAAFTQPVASAASLTSSYTMPAGTLTAGTQYYWKASAWNDRSESTNGAPASAGFITAVPPPACPGDLNNDHAVNTSDLTIMLGFFGAQVSPGTFADINGDGQVNTADLTILLGRFGSNCP